jgi:hypothetical protein
MSNNQYSSFFLTNAAYLDRNWEKQKTLDYYARNFPLRQPGQTKVFLLHKKDVCTLPITCIFFSKIQYTIFSTPPGFNFSKFLDPLQCHHFVVSGKQRPFEWRGAGSGRSFPVGKRCPKWVITQTDRSKIILASSVCASRTRIKMNEIKKYQHSNFCSWEISTF